MGDMNIMVIIIGFIVIFCGGFIQGLTSFGFSLLSVPLLSLVLPLKIVVPMLIVYSLLMNTIILFKVKGHVNLKKISILIITGILGTPLGVYILLVVNEDILKLLIGIIVVMSSLAMILGYKAHIKKENLAYVPVGIVSGLLNGSISLSGPPIILFLTNQGIEKQIFRANLTSYFLVLNIVTVPTYFFSGLITKVVINYTLIYLPALVLGILIGIKTGNQLEEKLFKKLTLGLITTMGVLSVISSVGLV